MPTLLQWQLLVFPEAVLHRLEVVGGGTAGRGENQDTYFIYMLRLFRRVVCVVWILEVSMRSNGSAHGDRLDRYTPPSSPRRARQVHKNHSTPAIQALRLKTDVERQPPASRGPRPVVGGDRRHW